MHEKRTPFNELNNEEQEQEQEQETNKIYENEQVKNHNSKNEFKEKIK